MNFYTQQHRYYCGIDLHARSMYVCILDAAGTIVVHKDLRAEPESFQRVIAPYRDDLAVAVECIFTWYWLADLCATERIPFVLGPQWRKPWPWPAGPFVLHFLQSPKFSPSIKASLDGFYIRLRKESSHGWALPTLR